jgi:alpha-beta hydrolase superfamily lysophospholipase
MAGTWKQIAALSAPAPPQERQVEFALRCMAYLWRRELRLARAAGRQHRALFLYGHSMGGIVARAALHSAAGDPGLGVLQGLLGLGLAGAGRRCWRCGRWGC